MSPEERELLNKSVSLAEDNNRMLRSIRRSQHFDSIMRIIYWVLIIGSALAGYFLLQPYIDQVVSLYQKTSAEIQSLKK
jgi:hypothetical protein